MLSRGKVVGEKSQSGWKLEEMLVLFIVLAEGDVRAGEETLEMQSSVLNV